MFEAKKSYGRDFLEPVLSGEMHDFHFGKHHAAYADNLNNLINNNANLSDKTLIEIIKSKHSIDPKVFNNAAQIWNHDFYWKSLARYKTSSPSSSLMSKISDDFGSIDKLCEELKQQSVALFGSGWAWVVFDKKDEKMKVFCTQNADNPLSYDNLVPLLTIDLWEHAYYIDYRNDRARYLDAVISGCINWEFMEKNMSLSSI